MQTFFSDSLLENNIIIPIMCYLMGLAGISKLKYKNDELTRHVKPEIEKR